MHTKKDVIQNKSFNVLIVISDIWFLTALINLFNSLETNVKWHIFKVMRQQLKDIHIINMNNNGWFSPCLLICYISNQSINISLSFEYIKNLLK